MSTKLSPETVWCSLNCASRSEEHTSELQSQSNLVCRLLLEKKKHFLPVLIASGERRGSAHTQAEICNSTCCAVRSPDAPLRRTPRGNRIFRALLARLRVPIL